MYDEGASAYVGGLFEWHAFSIANDGDARKNLYCSWDSKEDCKADEIPHDARGFAIWFSVHSSVEGVAMSPNACDGNGNGEGGKCPRD